MLDVLHWLPAEQRILYRIASLVWRSLVGLAPVYLRELCCPPLSAMSSRSVRSSQQDLLLVPFTRTPTKQIRVFSVVGHSTWNGFILNFAFLIEPFHLRLFLTLRLLCFPVLVLGALLSIVFLKRRYINVQHEWMNEYIQLVQLAGHTYAITQVAIRHT